MDFQKAKSFFDNQKQPVSLHQNMWFENTTVLFHSPRFNAIDKTKTALLIANKVAESGRDVLYLTTRSSMDKYRAESEHLFIYTPEFESIDDKRDYADLVFEAIEHSIRNTAIRTIVVDSVTRIAALSFGRNSSAAYIMKRLVTLQVKCKLSLLVLADDTTKATVRSLASLANGEIAPAQDHTAVADQKETNGTPVEHFGTVLPNIPCQVPPLTRQQRRALARQQAPNR